MNSDHTVELVIVAVLFYFTARDEVYLNKTTKNPQEVVNVVGVRWAWQFKYVSHATNPLIMPIMPRLTALPA